MLWWLAAGGLVVAGAIFLETCPCIQRARQRRADRLLIKRNDGRNIDARLPKGVRIDTPSPQGAHYDPNDRRIYGRKGNRRRDAHEKAHAIWDVRLSQKQRSEFLAIVNRNPSLHDHGVKIRPGKKCGPDGCWYPAEEMFSIMYAGHKEGREFAKPFKQFFTKELKR